MIGQSYIIYACTSAYHAHYLSVHVHFSLARNILYLSNIWEKNLTSRKCRAYRAISYKFANKSHYLNDVDVKRS